MAWIEFFFGIICRVHFRRKTHSFQHEYEKFVKRRLGDLVWFQFQVFSQSSQNWVILRMEFGKNCGFKTLLFSLTMYSVHSFWLFCLPHLNFNWNQKIVVHIFFTTSLKWTVEYNYCIAKLREHDSIYSLKQLKCHRLPLSASLAQKYKYMSEN